MDVSEEGPLLPFTRAGPVAIHAQLAAALRVRIATLPPGSRLATEEELITVYGVSRTTVRRAVQSLVEAGLLVKKQGKGTFVSQPRLTHPLDRLRPFVSMFVGAGKHPDGKILSYEWLDAVAPPVDVAHTAVAALRVRRLYLLDGQPEVLAEIFVPDPFGKQVTRAEIEEHPVYQVLQDKLGLVPHHADITVRSQLSPRSGANELQTDRDQPLLLMQRVTYNGDGRIIEWATYHLPAERFELRLTVQATAPEAVAYSFTNPGAELMLVTDKPQTDGDPRRDQDLGTNGPLA